MTERILIIVCVLVGLQAIGSAMCFGAEMNKTAGEDNPSPSGVHLMVCLTIIVVVAGLVFKSH